MGTLSVHLIYAMSRYIPVVKYGDTIHTNSVSDNIGTQYTLILA